MPHLRLVRWSCALMLAILLSVPAARADSALLLGIHPYLSASELHKRFRPLAGYLSDRLDRPVRVRVSSDYSAHLANIAKGKVDLAYVGPAPYIRLVEQSGPKRLLARLEVDSSPVFHGYIVTREDSPLNNLQALAGHAFAFGDPGSTMSHLVPRAMLIQAGVGRGDLSRYAHVANHENVALGVLVGDFDAGAVKEEIFARYRARGLRTLARTPSISEHLFLAADHLDENTVASVRAALLSLDSPDVLRSIKPDITALVPVKDADYGSLRELLALLPPAGETDDGDP